MNRLLTFFVALLSFGVSQPVRGDCGFIGELVGICEASEALRESAAALALSVDKAAESVPGERYLRMIDALNDPTTPKEQRERYQILANNLFSASPLTKYELSIRFGLRPEQNLDASTFYGPTGIKQDVEAWCKSNPTYQPTSAKNTLKSPMTQAQLGDFIDEKILAAINTLADEPPTGLRNVGRDQVQYSLPGQRGSALANKTGFQAGSGMGPKPYTWNGGTSDDLTNGPRRREARDLLREALDAYFGAADRSDTPLEPVFQRAYQPYIQPPFLFVTIDKAHLEAQSDEFLVEAIVYEAGENGMVAPDSDSLDDMWPIRLEKKHFLANSTLECGNPEVEIRWAAASLHRDTIVTAELLRQIAETRKALEMLEKEMGE